MTDCIFCKIIEKEIPANIVYEDNDFLAFLDINPVNPGHSLIITKEHFKDFASTSDEMLSKIIVIGKKIGQALIDELGADGFNFSTNNGKAAGQIIFHTHFHIIPRKLDDGLKHWGQKKYKEGETEEITQKLRKALKN